jgi:regulator of nucleoside diphosphate kinase
VETKPPIMVTEVDLRRLHECFGALRGVIADSVQEALEEELERAKVIESKEVPPTLVTMNSRVVFENVHNRRRREITLVYPQDANADQNRISVLSPVGAALLGLSVDQEIDWELPNGRSARFRIAEIVYQPEAAGDRQL